MTSTLSVEDQFELNDKLVDAIFTKQHAEVVRLLCDGAQVNHVGKHGNTPLHHASADTDAQTCQILIDAGADVHARNKDGCTPLAEAAHAGRLDVCTTLMKAGADVNSQSNDLETPLLQAAREKRLNTCVLLLENKADPNIQCANGYTPLLWAVIGLPVSNKKQVKFSPPARSGAGQSSFLLVNALVQHGTLLLPNARHENALHWAVSQDADLKLFKVLMSAVKGTEDLDLVDNKGESPLHLAAQSGNKDFCLELLAAGANPLLEQGGATPQEIARDNGHEELSSSIKAYADSKRAMLSIEAVVSQTKPSPPNPI
jgi:ankyrin repeat protein